MESETGQGTMDAAQLGLANDEIEVSTGREIFCGYVAGYQVLIQVLFMATSHLHIAYKQFMVDLNPLMQVLATKYPDASRASTAYVTIMTAIWRETDLYLQGLV